MKTRRLDCMRFLREYFYIPQSFKIKWCIIEECVKHDRELRLGLWIVGTQIYLDVARRRFFSIGKCGSVTRKIYPAKRQPYCHDRNMYLYSTYNTDSANYLSITLPKSYIADIYYPAVFNSAFFSDTLY